MKKLTLSVLLILTLLSAACSAPQSQEFTSAEGNFSIMTPVTLESSSQTVETDVGSIDIYMFAGEKGDAAYLVGYSDYPEGSVEDQEAVLDGAADGAAANVDGTIISKDPISLEEHPGRNVYVKATLDDGQEATVRLHVYLVGNRLYQILVVSPKDKEDTQSIDAFLSSFKLLE